jgi:hypothetical protein
MAGEMKNFYKVMVAASDLVSSVGTTSFYQFTPGVATAVNGITWKDLFDGSVLASRTEICGGVLAVAGVWGGTARFRIINVSTGAKIFPFAAEYIQGVDWTSSLQMDFRIPIVVLPADGFKLQFRSSDPGDGAGKTLALTSLDIITRG